MAIQPDGAIVLVAASPIRWDHRLVVGRLMPGGAPDAAFGVGGAVYLNWAGSDIWSASILVQPDGKLVVVATIATARAVEDDGDQIAIARLLSNGSPDASFGDGRGRVRIAGAAFQGYAGCNVEAGDAALDAQGRIVVAASPVCTGEGGGFDPQIGVVRVTVDGHLDPRFARRGTWTSTLGCSASTVAIEPDGKILVAGANDSSAPCQDGNFAGRLFVDRLNDDGSVDRSFGTGGSARLRLPKSVDASLSDAALSSDGALTLAGAIDLKPVVGRLTASGAPDPGFPLRRFKPGQHSQTDINSVALTADRGVLAVGTIWPERRQSRGFLANLTATGELDQAFVGGGLRRISFGGRDDDVTDVATDSNGRIVVVGSTGTPHGHRVLALARLLG